MKVDVYWNFHKKCWSVKNRTTGRIEKHAKCLLVENVKFVVQKAGRARVLREKKKNVHAFVRGTLASYKKIDGFDPSGQIRYNPYDMSTFQTLDEKPAKPTSLVYMSTDGKCYALDDTTVEMYDDEFLLYEEGKILNKITPLIWGLVSDYSESIPILHEDIFNSIVEIVIKGIRAYDYSKKVKLSTFLHGHIHNKTISLWRHKTKMMNNANAISKDSFTRERSLNSVYEMAWLNGDREVSDFSAPDMDHLYYQRRFSLDKIDSHIAMNSIIRTLVKKGRAPDAMLLGMICNKGFTIKEASKELGISGWAGSMRLRKIGNRFPSIKEALTVGVEDTSKFVSPLFTNII